MKKIIFTSILLSIGFSINAQDWWGNAKKIKGNGNLVTVERTTSSYDEISARGSFDLVLVHGEEGEISIEGEENIIPLLETKIEHHTLKIYYKKYTHINTTKKLTVTVPFKNIKGVRLGGSGNITSNNLIKATSFKVSLGGSGNIALKIDADKVTSSIGGSGDIALSGCINELICSIAGSGNINAYELTTNTLDASIAGTGNVHIQVQNDIHAKIIGSGNVYYKGNPTEIKNRSIGSGSIIDKN